jgi:hypothetical protein
MMLRSQVGIAFLVSFITGFITITFSCDGPCIQVYRIVGFATAAGAEALLKAPRSVITIDWSIIYGRFYEKIRG